jgi:hypothetical protein
MGTEKENTDYDEQVVPYSEGRKQILGDANTKAGTGQF